MSDIKNFERNKYFYGKLMTVRDFETEQSYFIEKQRLINRLIHGAGVVCGLKVKKAGDGDTTKIQINPGVAIDCCGREIIVPEKKVVDLKEEYSPGENEENDKPVYVLLKYDYCEKESVPVINNVSACEETCCYNRILETYKIEISKDMPDDCVPSDAGLCEVWSDAENPENFVDYWIKECPKCPQEPAVLLAAITISLQNFEIKEIDNAIIKDEEGFEKSLVFSNARLYELIKCVEKKAGLEKDLPCIKEISWVHDKEYDFFDETEHGEFLDKLENLTITFDRTINTRTINQKTLNVTAIAYSFGDIGTYGYVEQHVKKIDLPLHFIHVIWRDKVCFTVIPPRSNEGLRKALEDFTIGEAVGAGYSSLRTFVSVTQKRNTGLRLLIQLKGDFVLDDDGNPIDANHLKGKLPTGNGTPGGLFESWFDLKIESSKVDNVINEVRTNPGITGEVLAVNTDTSGKTMKPLLHALINHNAIYSKNELSYPLPDLVRIINVVYDGECDYAKGSAERLKAGLMENGIRAKITSLSELKESDRKSYEIILVRGKTISSNITTRMPDLRSRLSWDVSAGDTEIVANPYIKDANVFIVGGKNKGAVNKAVSEFLKNYTVP